MTTQYVRMTFQVTIKSVDPSNHATSEATPKTVYEIHASSPLSDYDRRYLGTVAQYPFGKGRQRWQIIDVARGALNGGPLRHNLSGDWYDTRAEAIQDLVLRGRFATL